MPATDPILCQVTRGAVVESVHRGRVVALDPKGEAVLSAGAVDRPVLLRSCAKPLQAVGMLRLGLDLHDAHLAVACASHDGTADHLRLVTEILAGAGRAVEVLANAPLLPLEPRAAAERLLAGGPDQLGHNCSGKHAAMVATCVSNRWPVEGYLHREHPLQRALLDTVEDLAGERADSVETDGCGAPIAAVSLVGLARAFARLATADRFTPGGRVTAAMVEHPEVVGGEQRDVTLLMRAVPGLVAKDGAEGCYVAALPDGRAVALKVADGSARARLPVMVAALARLGIDTPALAALAPTPVLGGGRPVGAVRSTDPSTWAELTGR